MQQRKQEEAAELEEQIRLLRLKKAKIENDLENERQQQYANLQQELYRACDEKDVSSVAALLRSGVTADLSDYFETACEENNNRFAELLINSGYRNQLNDKLSTAVQKGHVKLVKLFLRHRASIDVEDAQPDGQIFWDSIEEKTLGDIIHQAIVSDQPEVLDVLIKHAAALLEEILNEALKHDKYAKMGLMCPSQKILAEQIANVIEAKSYRSCLNSDSLPPFISHRDQSLLSEAIAANSMKCVKFLATEFKIVSHSRLLRYHPAVSNPLNQSWSQNCLDQNTFVIQNSFDNEMVWTAYWQDIDGNHGNSLSTSSIPTEIINEIVKLEIDEKNTDYKKYKTAVSVDKHLIDQIAAIFSCHKKNPLFNYYYDRTGSREIQGNVLHVAINLNHTEAAVYLIEQGIDIEEKYGNKLTRSVVSGSYWDSKRDYTPLMLAAEKGNSIVVDTLLQHAADLSPKNGEGKTAADLASTPEIKNKFLQMNSFAARISRLPNAEPPPPWARCTGTGRRMEDPIAVGNFLYDRSYYMTIDPAVAKSSKTIIQVLAGIEDEVSQQEKNARVANSQFNKGITLKFS